MVSPPQVNLTALVITGTTDASSNGGSRHAPTSAPAPSPSAGFAPDPAELGHYSMM
jgi:hypothetical protein